jgi:hypothetical protein
MLPRYHDVKVKQPKGREAEAAERRGASVARRRGNGSRQRVDGEGYSSTRVLEFDFALGCAANQKRGVALGCAANQKRGVDERAV